MSAVPRRRETRAGVKIIEIPRERRQLIQEAIDKLRKSLDPADHAFAGHIMELNCPFQGPASWTLDPRLNPWHKSGETEEI